MLNSGFMAVQCVQCSTMQVKQQKRSSRKWTCVMCNQKQSVTRVFACGPQAKDLRLFVQEFNISRGSALESCFEEKHHVMQEEAEEEACDRKRTDWSEYLDPTATNVIGGEEEDGDYDGDLEVVTEIMPNQICKASFPKRPRGGEPDFSTRTSRRSFTKCRRREINEQERACTTVKKAKPTKTMQSKGDRYLEEEIENVLGVDGFLPVTDHSMLWGGSDAKERHQQLRDVRVEEEVHPDFI